MPFSSNRPEPEPELPQSSSALIVSKAEGVPPLPDSSLARAYQAALPELRGLSRTELHPLNLDVAQVFTQLCGVLPKARALRTQMAELPDFDVGVLSDLERHTGALGHAHALFLATSQSRAALAQLAQTARQRRKLLLRDATSLELRGLLPQGCLGRLVRRRGFRHVAFDLAALVALFERHWPDVEGKTAVSPAELEEGAVLAEQLMVAIGRAQHAPDEVAEARRMRQRALTLAVRSYEEVRRAVTYLRWHHGDAESIAPSLYAGRRRRSKQRRASKSEGRGGQSKKE